jgi:hypothetical protein
MVGEPPSASVADAVQVKVEVTFTPELGLIEMPETTGSVLSTETLMLAESVSPEPSVAIALHIIVSDGDAVALVNVKLALVPSAVEPLVHSYEIVGLSPSASVADAVQVSVELVVTPVEGEITGVAITGGVLLITIEAEPPNPSPPSASVGVTITLQGSPFEVADDGRVAEILALDKIPPAYHSKL